MEQYITFAKKMAKASAEVILSYYNSDFAVDIKEDNSPVTIADKCAEKLMRDMIIEKFPDHGIIGEEYGEYNKDAEYTWVLDPIDGTKSFIHRVPLFGTLIALMKNNKPVLGVINLPVLKELIIGAVSRPTTFNGKEISVNSSASLKDSLLLCTDLLDVEKYQNLELFLFLTKQVKLYRSWGDCYMYSMLARGLADIAVDPVMNYWDIQALVPIIQGAGGIITDHQGNEVNEESTSIIASSPELHSQVVQILNKWK